MADEPFIGDIMIWPGVWAPRGWAFCRGQLLPIMQNQALYALIGNLYGGNGQTTFALPDLRGRAILGTDTTFGYRSLGTIGGSKTIPLSAVAVAEPGVPEEAESSDESGPPDVPINAAAFDSFPNDNRPPYIALHYVIALQGYFPTRD